MSVPRGTSHCRARLVDAPDPFAPSRPRGKYRNTPPHTATSHRVPPHAIHPHCFPTSLIPRPPGAARSVTAAALGRVASLALTTHTTHAAPVTRDLGAGGNGNPYDFVVDRGIN